MITETTIGTESSLDSELNSPHQNQTFFFEQLD